MFIVTQNGVACSGNVIRKIYVKNENEVWADVKDEGEMLVGKYESAEWADKAFWDIVGKLNSNDVNITNPVLETREYGCM